MPVKATPHYWGMIRNPEIVLMIERDGSEQSGSRRKLTLSERERMCLEGIARGLSTKQIAIQSKLSPRTIDSYVARVIKKLGSSSRSEAVIEASKRRLISI